MATVSFHPGAIHALKAQLRTKLPAVKSSHLSEAIAAGLGFATYAALTAAMKTASSDSPARSFQAAACTQRLAQLGYTLDVDLAAWLNPETKTALPWTLRTYQEYRALEAKVASEPMAVQNALLAKTPMERCHAWGVQLSRDSRGYWAFHLTAGVCGPEQSEQALAEEVCREWSL